MTMLNIDADNPLSFGIDYKGQHWLLRLSGAQWELLLRGAVVKTFRATKWQTAVSRALFHITEPQP